MRVTFGRRETIVGAASTALAGWPAAGRADAASDDFAAALSRLLVGRTVGDGGIAIDAPDLAENGNMVPVTISVESPMTVSDHVRQVVLLAPRNPVAEIARFRFTPACGRAWASTRIRLAESQELVVVAELSDGTLRQARRVIEVTIGGCGAV